MHSRKNIKKFEFFKNKCNFNSFIKIIKTAVENECLYQLKNKT